MDAPVAVMEAMSFATLGALTAQGALARAGELGDPRKARSRSAWATW